VLGRTVAHGLSLPAKPSQGYGLWHSDGAHAVARWPTARWSSVSDEVLSTSSGEASGKVRWIGAHRSGGATVRRLAATARRCFTTA
jgi:hypothetical protein